MSLVEKMFQNVRLSLNVESLKPDDEFKKICHSHPMISYEKIIEVITQINDEFSKHPHIFNEDLTGFAHTKIITKLKNLCIPILTIPEKYMLAKFEKSFFTFFVKNYKPALYEWSSEPYHCIQYSCDTRFNLMHMNQSKKENHLLKCKECHIYWYWDKKIKPEEMLEKAIHKLNELEPVYEEYMKEKSSIEDIIKRLTDHIIHKYFNINIIWPLKMDSNNLHYIQIMVKGYPTAISFGDIYESIIMNESKKSFNEKI